MTESWYRRAVRAGALVLAVAAVVAVAATGAGLLVPGADLPAGMRQTLRIAGLVVTGVGLVALAIYRRRHPVSPGQSDLMMTALVAAAAIMAVLTLLSLPFSRGLTINPSDSQSDDSILTDADSTDGSSGTSAGDGGRGIAATAGGDTAFTVAVDPDTGETTPIAIDPDTGRAVAFDPETGEAIPLSPEATGEGGDTGVRVPVGIDGTTGEVGIIGIVDVETGEVGIIGGSGSGVDLGEFNPDAFESLIELTGGDLDNIGVLGTIDPGQQPDGQIDFGNFDYSDVEVGEPTGTGGRDNIDWDGIARELQDAGLERAGDGSAGDGGGDGTGDAEGDGSAGDDEGDTSAGDSDTSSTDSPENRDFDPRTLVVLLQVALLVLAAIFAVRLRGWRPRPWSSRLPRPDETDPPVDAQQAEEGLEASLRAMSGSGEPREAIIAAYLRLLDALEVAGARRLAQEAPHEHLNRVLTPLGVRPDPVHRVAELFVMARFSDHPITEHHRTEAADALRMSLADLQAAEPADQGTPAASGGRSS